MKKKKYLPLYKTWVKAGELPEDGLCNCFGLCLSEDEYELDPEHELFPLMYPEETSNPPSGYWGCGPEEQMIDGNNWNKEFTPLRQNIVLLMAAMNGEL